MVSDVPTIFMCDISDEESVRGLWSNGVNTQLLQSLGFLKNIYYADVIINKNVRIRTSVNIQMYIDFCNSMR